MKLKEISELARSNEEAILYSTHWLDEDYNPTGGRIGFKTDEGHFVTAKWNNYQDCYDTVAEDNVEYFLPLTSNESDFIDELSTLLNRYSKDNVTNIPDYILAEYLNSIIDFTTKLNKETKEWNSSK